MLSLPGPPGEAEGAKIGFSMVFFLWSWTNPIVILYLLGMSVTLIMHRAFRRPDDEKPPRRRRGDEDN
jgi:hypothetical protein